MQFEIRGTKCYVDIENNGKVARFWGDLCLHGFSAIASTMEWLSPDASVSVNDDERNALIKDVMKFCRWRKFKVIFIDDKGKRLRLRSLNTDRRPPPAPTE